MTAGHVGMLVVIAFAAGVGITAIGPGGIFLTIGLFTLTPLAPGSVAATASATMIIAGVAGTLFYYHSGELRQRSNRHMAIVLSVSGLAGGLTGSWLNRFVTTEQFGGLLGVVAVGSGMAILYQVWSSVPPRAPIDTGRTSARMVLSIVGFVIGVLSGLLGVGGPVIAVPTLVILGVPILNAIAVAQVQSMAISLFATAGYAVRGQVDWGMATLVGVPLLVGLLVGWKIARRVEPGRLKIALGLILIALGPYLALWSRRS